MCPDIKPKQANQTSGENRRGDDADLDEIARRVNRITEENQHLFSQLLDGERRFRSLAKGVWKIQEDERRRFALELHDGIGQTLTALKHQLQRIEARVADDLKPAFADLVEIATGALNDTRELSRLLRPPVLDDLGLVAALQWLRRTMKQRVELEVHLSIEGLGEERLDPDIETLVFRVVQEALNNIVKHAGVSEADVQLKRSNNALLVVIEDHGIGFDVNARMRAGGSNESSGLRGIRDRIALFGGVLSLKSTGQQGTRLEMQVPLPENEGLGG